MSGQENGGRASERSAGSSTSQPRNYFITGRDVCVVKTKLMIEAMRPTAPEELGSTSFIERMESTSMICRAVVNDPGRYLDHLIKHEKHKVLVHEMVMISQWFEEILPQLFRNSKGEQTPGGTPTFCGSTPAAFLAYQMLCISAMNPILQKREGAQSLGTAVLDVIDVSLRACRDFMARDRDSSPGLVGRLTRSRGELHFSLATSGESTTWSVVNLRLIISHLDSLPQYVLTKLIHPDTQFMLTLIELIEHKPWNSIKIPMKSKVEAGSSPSTTSSVWDFSLTNPLFEPLEGMISRLINTYSNVIHKTFPRDVAIFYLNPQDQSGQILMVMNEGVDITDDDLVAKVEKDLEILVSRPKPTYEALEPSPYHVNVRAELAERKEAIIKIHGAMDSFEATTKEKRQNRLDRDFAFLNEMKKQQFCSKCKKPEARLRCSRCQVAYYCNQKCQSKHWATHKLTCEEPERQREREYDEILKYNTQNTK